MTYIYYIHHPAFVASAYQLASNAVPAAQIGTSVLG